MSSTSPSADDRASEGLLFDLPLAPEPAEAAVGGEPSADDGESRRDRPREGKGRGEARGGSEESGAEAAPASKAGRGRRRKKGERKRRVTSAGDLPLFPEAADGEGGSAAEEPEPAAGGLSGDEAGRGAARAEPAAAPEPATPAASEHAAPPVMERDPDAPSAPEAAASEPPERTPLSGRSAGSRTEPEVRREREARAAPAETETAAGAGERGEAREAGASRGVPLGRRFASGGVDLGIHLALALSAAGGSFGLGVRPVLDVALPIGLFLLVFSFLYTVISLAFWGRTPGMAAAGLVARSDGEPLTFGQTALRWLAGLVTLATLGLPTLLALIGGRSLADRVSGSQTLAAGG